MNILRYIKEVIKSILKFISSNNNYFKWHKNIYLLIVYISGILYIIAFTGIMAFNPQYLEFLHIIMRYYISIILLIRFNPFVEHTMTKFDKKLVFTCALLLFVSTSAYSIAMTYLKKLKIGKLIKNHLHFKKPLYQLIQ